MFKITYTRDAIKAMDRLPANLRKRIHSKVEQLAGNPDSLAANVKKLQGRPGYRLRVGNWRVIYNIIDGTPRVLHVVEVSPRGGAYKD